MVLDEISRSFQQLWENQAGVIVLLVIGVVVFVFLVVDAWRYRREQRHRRKLPPP